MRPRSNSNPGYWTLEAEEEANILVQNRPSCIKTIFSPSTLQDTLEGNTWDKITGEIYRQVSKYLKELNNNILYPKENLIIEPLSELEILPKSNIRNSRNVRGNLSLILFQVTFKDFKHLTYIFCIDKNNQSVLAHSLASTQRPNETLDRVYKAEKYLIIEGMESSANTYPLGTVLLQANIELSLKLGLEGRIGLNSIGNSGQFYYKLGFLPYNEFTYEELKEGNNCNGLIMFLAQEPIDAWTKRITAAPLLVSSQMLQISEEDLDKVTQEFSSLTPADKFFSNSSQNNSQSQSTPTEKNDQPPSNKNSLT